jgi:hypothetical protein
LPSHQASHKTAHVRFVIQTIPCGENRTRQIALFFNCVADSVIPYLQNKRKDYAIRLNQTNQKQFVRIKHILTTRFCLAMVSAPDQPVRSPFRDAAPPLPDGLTNAPDSLERAARYMTKKPPANATMRPADATEVGFPTFNRIAGKHQSKCKDSSSFD